MNFADVVGELGWEEPPPVTNEAWAASQQAMPEVIVSLEPAAVTSACESASMPDAAADLVAAARRIAEREPLRRLFWHCHHGIFVSRTELRREVRGWPELPAEVGESGPPFYLLVALSGLPWVQRFHAQRSVPEEIRSATYADIALWAREFRQERGAWGIRPRLIGWFLNHLSGILFRVGRLQFMQKPFPGQLVAFRHRVTGQVVALSEGGLRFRSDGQRDGAGKVFDETGAWTSRLVVDESAVAGHPIDPRGFVRPDCVCLPLSEWDWALRRGDPMLDMHIPAGEPMDYDACGESLRRAAAFFRRHFPERPFRGYCCTSWILDSQLREWLGPESNMVRFMQEFYDFPVLTDGFQTYERVWGCVPEDMRQAPQDTRLRKAIAQHVLAGGHVRSGGIFMLSEDLQWGGRIYWERSAAALRDLLGDG